MSILENPRVDVADDLIAAVFRKKTPAERIAMIVDAHETARQLARAGIRYHHSDWTEAQVREELARRMLGDAR
jgi:isopropylmalate/homocitrate/citramalate synthase